MIGNYSYRKALMQWRKGLMRGGVLLLGLAILGTPGCKPPPQESGSSGRRGGGSSQSPQGQKRGGEQGPQNLEREDTFLTPVMAMRATRGEISASIATTCNIVPLRTRMLNTEESGRLRFTEEWEEGQFVEEGTLIARLESETLDADIRNQKANVTLAEQNLEISRKSMNSAIREYETLQNLYVRGIAAQQDVDSQELNMQRAINSYRQEEIALQQAKDDLKQLTDRLERLEITTPFDGLLVASSTIEGTNPFSTTFGSETITDSDGRLVESGFSVAGIVDISTVYLRSDVTSRDIDDVRLGQVARATIYASRDLNVEGEVASISKSVDQETRAFQVDVKVENPERRLLPGMFGRVDVITETHRDAITIPKDAITRRNNRDVVFVAEEGTDVEYHVAREVPVETGIESRDSIEVTWGLQQGDSVILRGFEVLQDQTPVSVIYPDEPITPTDEEEEEAEEEESRKAAQDGDGEKSSDQANKESEAAS